MGDITDLLRRARADDRGAMDELVGQLYPELHRMAHARLAKNSTITLLDTTSMVHETYLRLRNSGRIDAECRGQFLAYVAHVMRSVIVDLARKRRADRRDGGAHDIPSPAKCWTDRKSPTTTSSGSTTLSSNSRRRTRA